MHAGRTIISPEPARLHEASGLGRRVQIRIDPAPCGGLRPARFFYSRPGRHLGRSTATFWPEYWTYERLLFRPEYQELSATKAGSTADYDGGRAAGTAGVIVMAGNSADH